MESKHFSHHHPLSFHQVQQAHCSGCKTPASGNVYACWQCNYFLHDQCFRATRSLRHPSHPLHPLSLVPVPTYPSATFFCNSCNLAGDGFSYSCSACEFDIHIHCALIPNSNSSPNFNPHSVYPPPNPIHSPVFPNSNPNPNSTPNFNPDLVYPPPNPIQSPVFPNSNPSPNSTPNFNPDLVYPPPNSIQSPVFPNSNSNPSPNSTPNFNPDLGNPPPAMAYPYQQPNPPPPEANPTYSTVVSAAAADPPQQLPKPSSSSIIKHFSHPHALKLMEIEQKKAKICSACECEVSGAAAYCCTEHFCGFNLHKSCFDSPREVRHKSHLEHPLTLLPSPPYSDGFTCNACLKDGKAFAYNCAACAYDLHIDCVQWPEAVARPDHKHDLTLYYSSPAADAAEEAAFECDVCRNPVHEMAWLYLCRECDFGTHLECVASGIQQEGGGGGAAAAAKAEEELLREVELKFAVLQLLLGAQGQNAATNAI